MCSAITCRQISKERHVTLATTPWTSVNVRRRRKKHHISLFLIKKTEVYVAHYGSKAYLLFRSNHISMMVCFERPFVKQFALCYQTDVRLSVLSCLSVTLEYCGQTVG